VKEDKSSPGPQSLRDDQISSADVPRRRFLGSIVLRSAAVAAVAMVASACGGADDCDGDVTRFRDSDPTDRVTVAADSCDTDS
jgi:hypothetical protein